MTSERTVPLLPMIKLRWLLIAFLTSTLAFAPGCSSDDGTPPETATAPAEPSASASGGLPAAQKIQSPEDPEPAPDVTLETMDGETIALANRPGEVLLVNFWATWCAPCRKEIPDLVDLQNEFGPAGLTVIGVSLDQQGEEAVRPFLGDYSINYPIVLDPEGAIEQAFGGVYGLPMTYVVGPDGRIRHRVLGLFPTEEMRPKLAALLRGDASTQS